VTERGDTVDHELTRLVAIVALAVAVRLGFAIVVLPHVAGPLSLLEGDPYDAIARNLVAGQGYVDRAGSPVTLRRLPGYPLFLAGVFAIAGPSLLAVQVVQALLGGALCIVVWRLGRELYPGTAAPYCAALVAALHPGLVQYAARYFSETLFTLLLAIAVWRWTRALAFDRNREWIATGVALGVATLTRGNAIILLPAVALSTLQRRSWRRAVTAVALFVVGVAAIIAPWSTYATRLAGSPVILSTWSAAPLYYGLYASRRALSGRSVGQLDDEAARMLRAEVGSHSTLTPAAQVARERAVADVVGEQIRAAPRETLIAALRGLGLVGVWGRSVWSTACYAAIHLPLLVLAAIGCARAHSSRPVVPVVLTVTFFWVFHALYYPLARFILPIVPLLAIPAGAWRYSSGLDGSLVSPMRYASTPRAASRPSQIAHTTND
jgi:4-amino-4-deoxy-L-arabinose transferase-like glycosyltransferase